MEDYLKVVVVGEVDAGKSTLIGRFLYETGSLPRETLKEVANICKELERDFEFAYLLDSLEEERKNQLTIDTTQVFFNNKKGKGFLFIDVPGHRELLKNMLSGSSYADIAILIVDVEKSIEEQTKRHAFILKFLGIEQIILALNKMDSVDFKKNTFEKERRKASDFFKKISMQPKCFIPISAKHGENLIEQSKKMLWYKGLPLIQTLNNCLMKEKSCFFRFPIQDIYSRGKVEILVGKIASGRIKNGDKIKILPINKESKIKKIRIFGKNRRTAQAPESIGLILKEINNLSRGQILCKPKLPDVKTEIYAKIFSIRTLHTKKILIFKCSTQTTLVQIKQINGVWDTASFEPKTNNGMLVENDVAEVVIASQTPLVVESFKESTALGRFVLQDNNEISAIGIIL